MKRVSALIAAALLLCGGLAEAKKGVRPDEIAELQKSGKIASFEKLNQAALAKHPDGHITKTALSAKDDRYDYKVRIAVPSGDSWNLKLDAGSATVLTDTKVLPPPLPSTYTPPTTPTPTPPAAPATH